MVIEAIKGRRSIRMFRDKEVEEEKLQRIIEAAQWAPSACNKQLWEFIVVSDAGTKKRIVEEARAVKFLKRAPLIVFVLYPRDVNREHAANIQSAAAAIQNMLLMAHEEGLGGVWVADCGERNVLRRLLKVPPRFLIISAVCLGYSERIPLAPRRRELEEIIHYEKYGEECPKRGYRSRGWSVNVVEDYRQRGIRATSPFPDFFENLSDEDEFRKEIDFACRYINSSDKVLDVLSFSGNHILEIMREKKFPCISIHDVSDEIRYFLDERRERLRIKGELNFNQGGLTRFSYSPNHFDVVTCFKKINLVPHPAELLSEMRRVLKEEGQLILSFWNSRSLSGICQCFRQKMLLRSGPLTNEGPVRPLSVGWLRMRLKEIGLEIVEEGGTKLVPKRCPGAGLLNRLEKRMPAFCRTVYMVCRKVNTDKIATDIH